MIYIRMDLTGETPQIDGEPGTLPARHRGLRDSRMLPNPGNP